MTQHFVSFHFSYNIKSNSQNKLMQYNGSGQANEPARNKFHETFQSSLIDNKQQKFMFDKSLISGIKENDVTKILDVGQDGGQMDANQLYDQHKETQTVLVQMRKKFDEVRTQTKRGESRSRNLQKTLDNLKTEQQKFIASQNQTKQNLDNTNKKLQYLTASMESSLYDKDIYLAAQERLKFDILYYKKKYFDMEILLNRDRTKLSSLKGSAFNKQRMSSKCRVILQSMEKTVVSKQNQRSKKIHSFYDVLNKKQDNAKKRDQRDRQISEVMMSAMTDKLQEEQQWQKILTANLFVKKTLKFKMERLIQKNSEIETIFHKIKQETNIIDSNDFINRFINREKNYGNLLQAIADKQSRLSREKAVRQELEEINKKYQDKNDELNEMSKEQKVYGTGSASIIQRYNDQILKIQRQKDMVYKWGTKIHMSFDAISGKKISRENVNKRYPRNQLKQLLVSSLGKLNQFLTQLNKPQVSKANQKKIDQAFRSINHKERVLTQEMQERNTRIKTMSTYEDMNQAQGNNFRDTEDVGDRDMVYDDMSQLEFLHHNRRAIKKNDLNRRFRIKTKPY